MCKSFCKSTAFKNQWYSFICQLIPSFQLFFVAEEVVRISPIQFISEFENDASFAILLTYFFTLPQSNIIFIWSQEAWVCLSALRFALNFDSRSCRGSWKFLSDLVLLAKFNNYANFPTSLMDFCLFSTITPHFKWMLKMEKQVLLTQSKKKEAWT